MKNLFTRADRPARRPITADEAVLLAFAENKVVQRVIYGISSLSLIVSILALEFTAPITAAIGITVTALSVIFYALTRWRLRNLYKEIRGTMALPSREQSFAFQNWRDLLGKLLSMP